MKLEDFESYGYDREKGVVIIHENHITPLAEYFSEKEIRFDILNKLPEQKVQARASLPLYSPEDVIRMSNKYDALQSCIHKSSLVLPFRNHECLEELTHKILWAKSKNFEVLCSELGSLRTHLEQTSSHNEILSAIESQRSRLYDFLDGYRERYEIALNPPQLENEEISCFEELLSKNEQIKRALLPSYENQSIKVDQLLGDLNDTFARYI